MGYPAYADGSQYAGYHSGEGRSHCFQASKPPPRRSLGDLPGNAPECTRLHQDAPGCTRMYQNAPGSFTGSAEVAKPPKIITNVANYPHNQPIITNVANYQHNQ